MLLVTRPKDVSFCKTPFCFSLRSQWTGPLLYFCKSCFSHLSQVCSIKCMRHLWMNDTGHTVHLHASFAFLFNTQLKSSSWHLLIFLPWLWIKLTLFYLFPAVLFTVEAERTRYESEFGGDVVMGCRFQPKKSSPGDALKVTWHWVTQGSFREVYRIDNGVEQLANQSPDYRGRASLLTEELEEGWAKLQVNTASKMFRST